METQLLDSTRSLRNLYFVRTAFQVAWAASVIITSANQPGIAAVLFILYPLWDFACTVYDLKTMSRSGSARTSQIINALLGVGAAIGIGLTVFHQPIYSVAVFGAWAFAAGLLQLVLGLIRRKQLGGGQWAMILSGAQSMLAGVAYFLGGLADKRHIKDVAGYATFGAFYFLIGGILLMRKLLKPAPIGAN
jgi:nitrate reductase NapE component